MKPFKKTASPYQMINISTGVVIILVFAYSAIFPVTGDGYPANCAHVSFYGKECQTCGLSQSFTEMTKANVTAARELNINGPLIFGFFASQLLLRIIAGSILFSIKGVKAPAVRERRINFLVITDAFVSVALFLVSFRFLLVFW
jgi:hypothetical protein